MPEEAEDQFQILFIIFTMINDGIFEFFAKCLKLFYKIWNEMRAQSLDFDRVKKLFYSMFFLFESVLFFIWIDWKALSALKDSLYRILAETNKTKPFDLETTSPTAVYKRKLNDFNNLMETWKYDNLKTFAGNDKSNLEPIKELKRILTEEVISMIKPKRLNVLCKGEKFDKINRNNKKSNRNK